MTEEKTVETEPAGGACFLQEVIDMHVHIGPDAVRPRRVDAVSAAQQAQAAGMRAIVLKNKQYITAPLADIAQKQVPGIRVFGGICLDREVGGVNPDAAALAGALGAKIVWMPTETAFNDLQKSKKPLMQRRFSRAITGIRALDAGGRPVPELDDVLDIIKEYDMILATGHFSTEEVLALIARAVEKGIRKILVNHPLTVSFGPTAPIEKQVEMASMGAFIEHTFVACMPAHDRLDPGEIREAVKAVGAERTVISSDFGQYHNPPPVEGMRMAILTLTGLGVTPAEMDLMTKINPAGLLGL